MDNPSPRSSKPGPVTVSWAAIRQDLANLLLHTAVNVSNTAELLRRLADATPTATEPTTIDDVRQAAVFIDQARQQLITNADTLIELDDPA